MVKVLHPNTISISCSDQNLFCSFQFFLKATQLERLTDDYQKIYEEKELTKILLDRKTQVTNLDYFDPCKP